MIRFLWFSVCKLRSVAMFIPIQSWKIFMLNLSISSVFFMLFNKFWIFEKFEFVITIFRQTMDFAYLFLSYVNSFAYRYFGTPAWTNVLFVCAGRAKDKEKYFYQSVNISLTVRMHTVRTSIDTQTYLRYLESQNPMSVFNWV